MNALRLVIAEDETVVRGMLARLLGMEDDIEVVGAAPDGETALSARLYPSVGVTEGLGQA